MHALIQLLFCNIGDIEKLLKMTLVVICSGSYNTFPPYRDYRSLYYLQFSSVPEWYHFQLPVPIRIPTMIKTNRNEASPINMEILDIS